MTEDADPRPEPATPSAEVGVRARYPRRNWFPAVTECLLDVPFQYPGGATGRGKAGHDCAVTSIADVFMK